MLRVPPLPPVEDPRWIALESAVGVASTAPALEGLVRGLLVELQRLTGLDSPYLTRIDRGMFGTLCGVSGDCLPLAIPGLEVMRIFASLISAQIAAPALSTERSAALAG
jgi:hypothetical protein